MNQRVLMYLYSTKNIVGSLLALVGLVLFFAGIIGALWPVVVIGLYLIGVLVTPGNAAIDLRSGFDPDDIRHALDTEVRALEGESALDSVIVENNRTGERRRLPAKAMFVFIGADPHTGWLRQRVALDRHGFVLTGRTAAAARPGDRRERDPPKP